MDSLLLLDSFRVSLSSSRDNLHPLDNSRVSHNNSKVSLLHRDNFKDNLSNSKGNLPPLVSFRVSLNNSKVNLNSNFKDSLPHNNSRDNHSNFKVNLNNKVDSLSTNKARFCTRTGKTYQK